MIKVSHFLCLSLMIAGVADLTAAPRIKKQEKIMQSIDLASLNIMTIKPMLPEEAKGGHIHRVRTIHDVCKRIHKGRSPRAINSVIPATEEVPYAFRVISGVQPVDPAVAEAMADRVQPVIFIYAGGWAGWPVRVPYRNQGQGLYSAFVNQRAGVMPGICVSFESPAGRAKASFGQALDQYCLKLVIDEVRRVNQHASIVLVGTCVGAMTVLNFIANYPQELDNVKAVILESPSISIEHIEKHTMAIRLGKFGRAFPRFFKYYFSVYDPQLPTILHTAKNIPHELPILIGAIKQDPTASYADIQKIVDALRTGGNLHTHVYETDDTEVAHGKMGKSTAWIGAVNMFLKGYGLPYLKQAIVQE